MTAPVTTEYSDTPRSVPRQRVKSWLEYRHPEYAANVARWSYARDHYTGEVIDPAKIARYLVKRSQGESEPAYRERCQLADYKNYFANIVEGFVGMLSNVEENANRVFNDENDLGLGDVADLTTPIGRLWRHADDEGHGWATVWKILAAELGVTHLAWCVVDSAGEAREPRVRILPAACVPNWRYGRDGVLEEVLVEEYADIRTSMEDAPDEARRFVRYTLAGWQRYELTRRRETLVLSGDGNEGRHEYIDPSRNHALPIFPVRLPMARPVGYLIARQANAIFNQESARDHLLRVANFPKLRIHGTQDHFDKIVEGIIAGNNVLHNPPDVGEHDYIAPSSEPAKIATEVIKEKVVNLYVTASREYGDAARERTATEAKQDVSAGAGAFLSLLKTALDDAENQALWRIEQQLHPGDQKYWFIARVERSEDFLPSDPDSEIDRLVKRVWGTAEKGVPLGVTAQVNAAEQVAKYQGLEYNIEEIKADVVYRALEQAMSSMIDLPIPAEVKAQTAIKLLTARGMVDPNEEAAAEGKQRFIDQITQQARTLAEASELQRRREAEAFPGFGGQ